MDSILSFQNMTEASEPEWLGLNRRVHRVFDHWSAGHADGQVLSARDYDPDDPYQRVESARIEPEPDMELASSLGRLGMGAAGYEKLSTGFERYHIIDEGLKAHRRGESILITTLHLHNVLDTAITHNNLFVTAGGDPRVAEINDIVANPMMSRLAIGELAVYRVLSAAGGIDNALPPAAADYGMNKDDIRTLERIYAPALKQRLERGAIFHWSLPGTRGITETASDGSSTTYIKPPHEGIIKIAQKRFKLAIPVAMIVKFGDVDLEMLAPRRLESADDVHGMMREMTAVAQELSGDTVIYGRPVKARRLFDSITLDYL